MTDLERRLRAALHGASEQAPPGLMEAVLRRRKRHRIRVGASVLAVGVAAALVVPPVTNALSGIDRPGAGRAPAHSSHGSRPPSALHPAAAPGTVLRGCGDLSNAGAIGGHWQAHSTHAAQAMWFLDGGHSWGPIRLYVAIVVVAGLKPGSVVVVRMAPGSRGDLRFLYGPMDSLNPGTRYTMRSGEAGVTFVTCSPDQQIVRSSRYTDYYGGYLVRGARCVPVLVFVPGRARPLHIGLGACPGH